MADSLREPWICKYLIETGENYGGRLMDVPLRDKKRKVQLVEFLTFPSGTDDSCPIYAVVSDKSHKIPIQFTNEALELYEKKNGLNRLTQQRNAVIQIKDFRPKFTRVPPGNNVRTLSAQSYLALEVGYVDVLGSDGEGLFGNPKDIEENDKLKLWSDGLREDGGGGNILKLKKEALQSSDRIERVLASTVKSVTRSFPTPKEKEHLKPETMTESTNKLYIHNSPAQEDHKKLFERSWRSTRRNYKILIKKSLSVKGQLKDMPVGLDLPAASTSKESIQATPTLARHRPAPGRPPSQHPLDLDSSQPVAANHEHELSPEPRPTTPSEWPSSPTSQVDRAEFVAADINMVPSENTRAAEANVDGSNALTAKVEDQLAASPASVSATQPTLKPSPSPSPIKPMPSPSLGPFPSPKIHPIAFPHHSHIRRDVRRKVPEPPQPEPPQPKSSGPGLILVPNSDTSGTTASQPQTQSQLNSQQPTSQFGEIFATRNQSRLESVNTAEDEIKGKSDQPRTETSNKIDVVSQPMSYDGDCSSPEVPPPRKRSRRPTPDVRAHREPSEGQFEQQEENEEEEIDQLESGGEDTMAEEDQSLAKKSQSYGLSDDDAQTDYMLMKQPMRKAGSSKEGLKSARKFASFRSPDDDKDHIRSLSSAIPSRAVSPQWPPKKPRNRELPLEETNAIQVTTRESATEIGDKDHDAEAWKKPSFMRNLAKSNLEDNLIAGASIKQEAHPQSHSRGHSAIPTTPPAMDRPRVPSAAIVPEVNQINSDSHAPASATVKLSKRNKRNHTQMSESPAADEGASNRKKPRVGSGSSATRSFHTGSGPVMSQSRGSGEEQPDNKSLPQADLESDTRSKLMGYAVNLYHVPRDNGDGPRLLGWDEFGEIILDIGRERWRREVSRSTPR